MLGMGLYEASRLPAVARCDAVAGGVGTLAIGRSRGEGIELGKGMTEHLDSTSLQPKPRRADVEERSQGKSSPDSGVEPPGQEGVSTPCGRSTRRGIGWGEARP